MIWIPGIRTVVRGGIASAMVRSRQEVGVQEVTNSNPLTELQGLGTVEVREVAHSDPITLEGSLGASRGRRISETTLGTKTRGNIHQDPSHCVGNLLQEGDGRLPESSERLVIGQTFPPPTDPSDPVPWDRALHIANDGLAQGVPSGETSFHPSIIHL